MVATMLKLSCAGCGAPLDIGPDTDMFACSYCGTQQRVERTGGVVALKRVEGAIKAVQRGTDRTAAELALIRLEKEIAEAQVTKASAVAMQQRKDADGRRGRSYLCLFTFAISWFVFSALISAVGVKGEAVGSVGFLLAAILTVIVYNKKKVPPLETPRIAMLWDGHIKKLKDERAANRALLDG